MNSPEGLQALLDERAIQHALYAAARAMDDRDWVALTAIIADDAVGDVGTGRLEGGASHRRGNPRLPRLVRAHPASARQSRHQGDG